MKKLYTEFPNLMGGICSMDRGNGTHWIGGCVSHYTHSDTYPFKTQHNITQYREKCLKRGDIGCTKPHAQCTSNVKGTVLSS
jgi:hypothetical protein